MESKIKKSKKLFLGERESIWFKAVTSSYVFAKENIKVMQQSC